MAEVKTKPNTKSNETASEEEVERQEVDPIAALNLLDEVVSKVQLNRKDTVTTIRAVKIIRDALSK